MSDPSINAGQTLPASTLQKFGQLGSFTPTLIALTSNPTLGAASTQTGIWHRNGKLITIVFKIVFGSSGVAVGSGFYGISNLPFSVNTTTNTCVGNAFFGDVSTGKNYPILPIINSSTQILFGTILDNTTTTTVPETLGVIDQATPVAPAAGDSYQGQFMYLSA